MKKCFRKLLFIIALVTVVVTSSNGQEIGIRFGGTSGHYGAAVDGLFDAGQFSRIHADLGFYKGGVGIDALWDFLYKPLGAEAFSWYVGVGPSTYIGDKFDLGVSGEIGIQYYFSGVPISLGLDWRPTFWIVSETRFGADSFGLNVRYVFGK